MNDWVDLPIINAIDYFQGVLCYFLNFARKYGSFFGLIGLVWTSIRLIRQMAKETINTILQKE